MANYNLVVLAGTAVDVRIRSDNVGVFDLHIREQNKPLQVIQCHVLTGEALAKADIDGLSVLVHGSLGSTTPDTFWDCLPTVDVSQWEIL